jgi:hypothetical protein
VAYHHLLLQRHPMAGLDFHLELTFTWPPVPVPFTPHIVGQLMQGFGGASLTSNVTADGMTIVQRDSDIQYGIPHIPLPFINCVLALLWTGLSGSKSYFGPSKVIANGKPVAAALIVCVNPQLNCDDPTALPTGAALSSSSVVCTMTWGDFLGGLFAAAIDVAITFVLNKLGSAIGKGIAGRAGVAATSWVFDAIGVTATAVLQQITGSPVGYTFSVPGHLGGEWANPGNWGALVGHPLGDLAAGALHLDSPLPSPPPSPIGNHIADDPAVEQH